MSILQQTHCHIIYAVPSCNPTSENFAKVSSEQLISWILPALTTDSFELTCLLNSHRSLGSDLEIYKRVDAYYMNFKKKDIDAAKDFLEGICTSVTLAELSLRLAPYENDNWKYSYTNPKNKRPSGVYISKEISNFLKYAQPHHEDYMNYYVCLFCTRRKFSNRPSICYADILIWKMLSKSLYL